MRVPSCTVLFASKTKGLNKLRQKDERNVVYATMEDAEMDGHIYLCKEDLISKALAKYPYMTSAGIMRGATVLIKEKSLMEKDGHYSLTGTVRAENELAKYCANCLTSNQPLEAIDVAERLPAVEKEQGITLSESQRTAVVGSLSHRLSIITGGPGSGKTTLLRSICSVFGAETLTDILLLAPTGKAARRLAKQAHGAAHTIHSVLHSSRGKPYLDREGCFRARLIIVDEVSMVETAIMRDILRALRDKSRLILVGDPAQLPSVGPGTVFADMLACGFPVFELTDNFRLMEKFNALAENIQRIRVKDAELTYDESFHMLSAKTAGEAESMMIELYVGLQLDGKSVQMLSPSGKTRRCSVNVLNTLAQGLVNPACTGTLEVPIGNQVYLMLYRILKMFQ